MFDFSDLPRKFYKIRSVILAQNLEKPRKGFPWFQPSKNDPSQLGLPLILNSVGVTHPVDLCSPNSSNPPQMALQMISQHPNSKLPWMVLSQRVSLK